MNNQFKTAKSDLKIIIDLGSSGTKGFINNVPFYMDSSISVHRPSNQGWSEKEIENYVMFDNKKYWVGQGDGDLYLDESKFEKALIKVIAFIAKGIYILLTQGQISVDETGYYVVKLAIFLPVGEANMKDTFLSLLKKQLRNIDTGWGKYKFKIEELKLQPEGAGLLTGLKDLYRNHNNAVLMLGFRNASLLIYTQQEINFIPSNLGYHTVVAKTLAAMGLSFNNNYYRQILLENKPTNFDLNSRLLKSNHPTFREKELEQLKATFTKEINIYLDKVQRFLESNISNTPIDYLCFGGGTAYFLYDELQALLANAPFTLLWQGRKKLPNLEIPELSPNPRFPHVHNYRWLDAYYLNYYVNF